MNEPIILEIGIDLCLDCPYPDCIGTDTELCHLMKDEVKRVRAQIKTEKIAHEKRMLDGIQALTEDGPLTMPELAKRLECDYAEIETLRRHRKLHWRKDKGEKNIIFITGVT